MDIFENKDFKMRIKLIKQNFTKICTTKDGSTQF